MVSHTGKQGKVKVLFVAADPTNTGLRLGEEIREIKQKILLTKYRDVLDIEQIWAVRPRDLLQYFDDYQPNVVHFSAHGSPSGEIILTDPNNSRRSKPVSTEALEALFTTMKDNIRVVILNACYSQIQAEAITKVIDCAIGMSNKIGDKAAITFAAEFYGAIGFGHSIQRAFDEGITALKLEGFTTHHIPTLLFKADVHPSQVRIIASVQDIASIELKRVQDALLYGDYNSAYGGIENIMRTYYNNMASKDKAKLKYLEALVHLDGESPSDRGYQEILDIEKLMDVAITLNRTNSYLLALAMFHHDYFIRHPVRPGKWEVYRLLKLVQAFPLTSDDVYKLEAYLKERIGDHDEVHELLKQMIKIDGNSDEKENLELLLRCQPKLFHTYLRIYLRGSSYIYISPSPEWG